MKLRIGIFALVLALLQACVTSQEEPGPAATENAAKLTYVPREGLSAKERFLEALSLLENGEPESARAELVLYLEQQPRSELGKDLLAQIDIPVSSYFPEDYREIRLEPGLSLSGVAQRYLGSVYKFYALARYNGIDKPSRLTVGQPIRIPLTEAAIVAFEAPPETAKEVAGEALEVGQWPAAVHEAAVAAQVQKLHRQALDAYRAQDLDKAIALWTESLELDPDYESARLYRSQAVVLKERLNNLN